MAQTVKNLPATAGDTRDTGSVPGLGTSPGVGMATHSSILSVFFPVFLKNPMDRGAWAGH